MSDQFAELPSDSERIIEVPLDSKQDPSVSEIHGEPIIEPPNSNRHQLPDGIDPALVDEIQRFLIPTVRDDDEEEWEYEDEAPGKENDDDHSDTSSVSSEFDETLSERLAALADMVHPAYRDRVSTLSDATSSLFRGAVSISTKAFWIVSTSMLLLGVPWALAYSEDQQLMEMEKEERMRMIGNEVLTQDGAAGAMDSLTGAREIKASV